MKRVFILIAFPILLLRLPAIAQDASSTPTNTQPSGPASTAASIAAKEDAEDRYKRMAADLQAVQADNETLRAKISTMEQEIQTLREAQARPADNSGIQDEMKRLAEKIQEVDKKRLEDKDAISQEIRKSIGGLEKTLAAPLPPIHDSRAKASATTESSAPVNGYSYTIKAGETLGEVVSAYNKDYKSKGLKPITLRQAMEANPSIDWNRLKVGQKIVIPRPDGG